MKANGIYPIGQNLSLLDILGFLLGGPIYHYWTYMGFFQGGNKKANGRTALGFPQRNGDAAFL